jgi:hypothetical protein
VKARQKRGRNGGSALLIALAVVAIIGIGVASYLMLARSQHGLVAESQAWNTALTLAEAGIEEGMAQVNVVFGTNYIPSATTNWGWPVSGVFGPRTNVMTNGSYSAIIIQGTPCPTIICTGYTIVPLNAQPIQRTVMVTTTNMPAFGQAMAVQLDIDTKGNGLTVDSYDSSDPAHSTTNGMYDPTTFKAGGDVCSLGGLINVQNASIYGKLRTGPNGSYAIGNGTVGDVNYNVKGSIEPGWYFNDFNMLFKDVQAPYTSGFVVFPINLGTNTYVLGTGDYYVNGDLIINQNETMYINGDTRLYVTGNINMKSQNACYISIAPGADLKLYCGTADGTPVSAALTQVNTVGNAGSFQFFGLPSCTSVTWNGNNAYVGTLYAPEADFKAGGGGSATIDWQGACVVNNLTLNGHFDFHFDENLKRFGPASGYVVNSWQEL